MNEFLMYHKEGTEFVVCGHDELIKKGWIYSKAGRHYRHDDSLDTYIVKQMIEDFEGETLTVESLNLKVDPKVWYFVKENGFFWPVWTFLKDNIGCSRFDFDSICEGDTCIEGMTPLDGWFICKKCGFNLRTIK